MNSPGDVASETRWQRHDEPRRVTLTRTLGIAVVGGALLAHLWGGLSRWPVATTLMLWPAVGGHYIELWFLNRLRPRLPLNRAWHIVARLAVWFIGGIALALGMRFTALALNAPVRTPNLVFWVPGAVFVGIEMVVHLALQLGGRPSFFNGRG